MIRNLNVPIEERVIEDAKIAAKRAGMLLRAWVERALQAAADAERPAPRERTYEPAE